MAWVRQSFEHAGFRVELLDTGVSFQDYSLSLTPVNPEEAHAWAMMLRKSARRLEEIGKNLQ